MRTKTMREIAALADKTTGTPEFEAEVERDAQLAHELEQRIRIQILSPFLAAHPDAKGEVIAPALLRIAAVHLMTEYEMGIEDFVELARQVATGAQAHAARLRAIILGRGQS